jgi:hypothetical protein
MKQAESIPRAEGAHLVQFLVQKAHVDPFKNTLSAHQISILIFSFIILTAKSHGNGSE